MKKAKGKSKRTKKGSQQRESEEKEAKGRKSAKAKRSRKKAEKHGTRCGQMLTPPIILFVCAVSLPLSPRYNWGFVKQPNHVQVFMMTRTNQVYRRPLCSTTRSAW